MRGATIYLNDALEERERERRRRSRKAFAGAAAIALLGFAAMMRKPPTPPAPKANERVVEKLVEKVVEVECTRMHAPPASSSQLGEARPAVVRTPVPGPERLLPFAWPGEPLPEPLRPVHHLCVTPRRLGLRGAGGSDVVTVSNLGDMPIRITQIGIVSNRDASGFVVDAQRCSGRQLQPGERCTISVGVREAKRETMYVLIANSEEEPDWLRVDS